MNRQQGENWGPDVAVPSTFGHLLRRYRRDSGLTQEQLAEQAGVSVRAIGDLERGDKHRPRDATVELLADALHLSGPERVAFLVSVSPRGELIRKHGNDAARLSPVAVHPTYPLPVASPLIGREELLSTVVEAFPDGSVRPGRVPGSERPGLVLIAGEAGIGKTRVLAEIARRAQERGLIVLAGGSYEAEGRLPLGPVHDALLDYMQAQADSVLQVQIGGWLPDLARVVPELRDRFPHLPDGHVGNLEEQRPRIFWTIARVFERICEVQPLVLLLDDLQWADETTLQVLHYLTRHPRLDRMLIVGVYRSAGSSGAEELEGLLLHTARERRVCRIDLQPIDVSGLATVLGTRLGGVCAPDLARAVHERSGGNPFFALEMVGLLQQEGRLAADSGEGGTVWSLKQGMGGDLPIAVRDTVAKRLKGLESHAVEALQLAAAIGRQVPYAILRDLWEDGERSLLRAIDCAIAAQILGETELGYTFRHPVLQEVVYCQLSAAHRAWLHAQIARSLEDMYGARADEHASELAHHLVAGGRDEARALHYLTLAADASARASGWQEALNTYQTALKYATGDRTVGDLQERIGSVLKALGRYDDAVAALQEALTRYEREGDLLRVGAVTAALVQVHALRGSWDQGRAYATRVISQIERLSPRSAELSRTLTDLHLALTYLYDVGLEERLHEAERAAELARVLPDAGLLAQADMQRAFLLYALRRFREAQEAINALTPLAERLRDASTLRFAVDILADIHKLEGRFEPCLRGRERALAYAEQRPDEPHWIMVSLAQLAEARFLLGNWSEARALYDRAVRMSGLYPAPHYAAFALLGLGALLLAEGQWEEATQLIETCIADARSTNDVHWVRNGERLLAHRDLLQGRPREALLRLESQGPDHTGTLYLRAWAHLDSGGVERAAAAIDRSITIATQWENRLDLCEALIVRGRICVRQGCFEDAGRSFMEALSLARSMPYPYGEARALREWGEADRQRGEHEQARERLAEAQAILQRLGVKRHLELSP